MNPSVAQPQDDDMSRRGFVKVAIGGIGLLYAGAVGYPIYRYLNSPVEKSIIEAAITDVTIPKADELPKGSGMVFKFGARPALLIHHESGEWVAFSAVCTHLACTVKYDESQRKITCACHGGVYDSRTGDNIAGPPPKPLRRFAVKVNEGSVTVSKA